MEHSQADGSETPQSIDRLLLQHKRTTYQDPIRLPSAHLTAIPQTSQNFWRSIQQSVLTVKQYPSPCRQIGPILRNVPHIPVGDSVKEHAGTELILKGASTWSTKAPYCTRLPYKRSHLMDITIGVPQPSFCKLADAPPKPWSGYDSTTSQPVQNNLLAVLTLGWCYVISVKLLEMRCNGEKIPIMYEPAGAPIQKDKSEPISGHFTVNIGTVTYAEQYWWRKVIESDSGWSAKIRHKDASTDTFSTYRSPWECHLRGSRDLEVRCKIDSIHCETSCQPPSSAVAMKYLRSFASLHQASDQLEAAFTATLTIPAHMRHGSVAVLPALFSTTETPRNSKIVDTPSVDFMEMIPYAMTLSCLAPAIPSALAGCFWREGVYSNMVDQWLRPAIAHTRELLLLNYEEATVAMLVQRCPPIGPIVLSTVLTGLLPRLLDIMSSYVLPTCLESSCWTQSVQSYIDPQFYDLKHREEGAHQACVLLGKTLTGPSNCASPRGLTHSCTGT